MKVKVSIPQSYDDITIAEWKQLESAWSQSQGNLDKTSKCIQVLCGLSARQVKALSAKQFNAIVSRLEWLLSGQDHEHELVAKFEMNGVTYGFITDWDKLTTGEFIDLETAGTGGLTENLEMAMSIWYRPVVIDRGEFYQIEDYAPSSEKTKAMSQAPMSAALGALAFFLTTAKGLAIDTHLYLRAAARPTNSHRNGGGIVRFIRWLKGMFSKSTP